LHIYYMRQKKVRGVNIKISRKVKEVKKEILEIIFWKQILRSEIIFRKLKTKTFSFQKSCSVIQNLIKIFFFSGTQFMYSQLYRNHFPEAFCNPISEKHFHHHRLHHHWSRNSEDQSIYFLSFNNLSRITLSFRKNEVWWVQEANVEVQEEIAVIKRRSKSSTNKPKCRKSTNKKSPVSQTSRRQNSQENNKFETKRPIKTENNKIMKIWDQIHKKKIKE